MKFRTRFIPVLEDLKAYTWGTFRSDFLAAVMVLIILVPQAMAYSLIAGLEPIYGLYAAFVPLFFYGILGTSPHLSIGPVAISSLLVCSGASLIVAPFNPEYLQVVVLLGLLVGIVQTLMGVLRLGFLVNYLSLPVINGFISAAAILIILSQVKHVLGIQVESGKNAFVAIYKIAKSIPQAHTMSIVFGSVTFIIMLISRRLFKKFPMALVLVVVFSILTYILKLPENGLVVVGLLPKGLPEFQVPNLDWNLILKMWPTVLTVSFIGIMECISIAKSLEQQQDQYEVRPNQELLAIGIAKIAGSFFQSYPSSGSFARSSVNFSMNAKTGVSSILLAVLLGLVLVFFTTAFQYIPYSVLAAIIIASVYRMIKVRDAISLWKIRKRDWITMFITFLTTLIFGIEFGVLAGILLSFAILLYNSSTPHFAELGLVDGERIYRNVDRFPDARCSSSYILFRFDERIFFGNALYFKDQVLNRIKLRNESIQFLILEMSNVSEIDVTGLQALMDLNKHLKKLGATLLIAEANGPARDIFHRANFYEHCPIEQHFTCIESAVEYTETGVNNDLHLVSQHNNK